jgi:tellurite resistance protein
MSAITFAREEAQEIARALAAVAAADGAILAREEMLLDEFAVANGVGGHAWIAKPLDAGRLARAVTDGDKQREVLRLCLRMALVDGDYAEAERRTIGRIAAAFGISDGELRALTAAALAP